MSSIVPTPQSSSTPSSPPLQSTPDSHLDDSDSDVESTHEDAAAEKGTPKTADVGPHNCSCFINIPECEENCAWLSYWSLPDDRRAVLIEALQRIRKFYNASLKFPTNALCKMQWHFELWLLRQLHLPAILGKVKCHKFTAHRPIGKRWAQFISSHVSGFGHIVDVVSGCRPWFELCVEATDLGMFEDPQDVLQFLLTPPQSAKSAEPAAFYTLMRLSSDFDHLHEYAMRNREPGDEKVHVTSSGYRKIFLIRIEEMQELLPKLHEFLWSSSSLKTEIRQHFPLLKGKLFVPKTSHPFPPRPKSPENLIGAVPYRAEDALSLRTPGKHLTSTCVNIIGSLLWTNRLYARARQDQFDAAILWLQACMVTTTNQEKTFEPSVSTLLVNAINDYSIIHSQIALETRQLPPTIVHTPMRIHLPVLLNNVYWSLHVYSSQDRTLTVYNPTRLHLNAEVVDKGLSIEIARCLDICASTRNREKVRRLRSMDLDTYLQDVKVIIDETFPQIDNLCDAGLSIINAAEQLLAGATNVNPGFCKSKETINSWREQLSVILSDQSLVSSSKVESRNMTPAVPMASVQTPAAETDNAVSHPNITTDPHNGVAAAETAPPSAPSAPPMPDVPAVAPAVAPVAATATETNLQQAEDVEAAHCMQVEADFDEAEIEAQVTIQAVTQPESPNSEKHVAPQEASLASDSNQLDARSHSPPCDSMQPLRKKARRQVILFSRRQRQILSRRQKARRHSKHPPPPRPAAVASDPVPPSKEPIVADTEMPESSQTGMTCSSNSSSSLEPALIVNPTSSNSASDRLASVAPVSKPIVSAPPAASRMRSLKRPRIEDSQVSMMSISPAVTVKIEPPDAWTASGTGTGTGTGNGTTGAESEHWMPMKDGSRFIYTQLFRTSQFSSLASAEAFHSMAPPSP